MLHSRLCYLLIATALIITAIAQHAVYAMPAYRLNDLAVAIADKHVALRVDLARIALSELATIYDEEASRARRDVQQKNNKPGLWRWSRAVQAWPQTTRSLPHPSR